MYKYLLYRLYIFSIVLYDFQLWYFKEALLYQSLKELRKIQRRVAFQIIKTFCILLLYKVETIAGLIPIYLLLQQSLIIKIDSSTTSRSLNRISSRDYKRTQQEVTNVLLPYLYKVLIVYANNKQSYPNIYVQSILLLYVNLMSSIRTPCYICQSCKPQTQYFSNILSFLSFFHFSFFYLYFLQMIKRYVTVVT